jgi:hypothetical protein
MKYADGQTNAVFPSCVHGMYFVPKKHVKVTVICHIWMLSVIRTGTKLFPRNKIVLLATTSVCVWNNLCVPKHVILRLVFMGLTEAIAVTTNANWSGKENPPRHIDRLLGRKGHSRVLLLTFKKCWMSRPLQNRLLLRSMRLSHRWIPVAGWNCQGRSRSPGMKMQCNKPSSNAGDTFLESGAFGESALDELNIVWD